MAHEILPDYFARRWIGDSATQAHIVSDCSLFIDYVETPGKTISGVGSSAVLGKGTVKIHFLVDGEKHGRITLTDVLYVPSIPYHLISLGRLTAGTGLAYWGINDEIEIIDTRRDCVVGQGTKVSNLYEFNVEPEVPVQSFQPVLAEPGTTGTFPLDI